MTTVRRLTINPIQGLSFLLLSFILINNFIYDIDIMVNQLVFKFTVLIFLISMLFYIKKINYGFLYFFIFLTFTLYALLTVNESTDFNRAISYTMTILSFFLIFYISKYLKLNKAMFYLYLVIYLVICVVILVKSDRGIINPNWVGMTLFYSIALFMYDKRKTVLMVLLSFGFLTSFFILESRGTSVSYLAAILSLLFLNISHKFVRFAIIIILASIAIGYFYFLDFLTNYREVVELLIAQYTERGLGGRENVFIIGYQYLLDSGFLGYGIEMSGGFEDPEKEKGVHIHFGLLDLALKFSIVIVAVYLIFVYYFIRKVNIKFLPFVAGSLMTVFYYNGLAPSHLGLNLLLYLLLGYAYYNSVSLKNIPRKYNE